ncbi:hypothetical protein ACTG9Q_32805 [Actinokineospora sp. 24-640]
MLLFVLSASTLAVVLGFNALDVGDKVASVVSCLVAVITLGVTGAASRVSSRVDDSVEELVVSRLSVQSARHVRQEMLAHDLSFPDPLRVPWSSVNGPVAASPDVVLGRLSGARRTALRLHGDITMLASVVAGLPARQLVLLGDEGSGKSVAVLLVTQSLVDDARVPILIDLAGLATGSERIEEYLVRCVKTALPSDMSADAAHKVMSRLLEQGRIVPILDGMDGLAPQARAILLEDVQSWGSPFVMTSRPLEYETAVLTAGVTAARALVVRLTQLPVPEIRAHLTAGRSDADRRWAGVLARLLKPGPLREVLSSPLMSRMARKAYASPDSDPGELLLFDTVDALERHLVAAAHQRDETLTWLAGLASYLTRRGARHMDLTAPLIPSGWGPHRQRSLTILVAFGGAVFAAWYGSLIDWSGQRIDTLAGVASWAAVLVAYVMIRLAFRSRVEAAVTFRFKIRFRALLGGAASAVGVVTMMNIVTLLAPDSSLQLSGQALVVGVIILTLAVAVLGIFMWASITEPDAEEWAPQPLAALRRDGIALAAHFPLPILAACAYCAVTGNWHEYHVWLTLVLLASTAVFDQIPGTGWSRWVLRQTILARSVPTPRSGLGPSLENARAKGLLRATGTSYRFQHVKIQNHLAEIARDRPRHDQPETDHESKTGSFAARRLRRKLRSPRR